MQFLCFMPAIQNPGKQHRQDSQNILWCPKLFIWAFYRTLLIKNAEKGVGSYQWPENKTSLIFMDSSTTSRQCPVLKLNLYLPLLPFLALDTAITMLRAKAVRNWVLIKCAGTDSAQVTTPTFTPASLLCQLWAQQLQWLLPKSIQKGNCIIAIQLYFSRNEHKHLARAKWIQKAGAELPLLHSWDVWCCCTHTT